MVATTLCLSLAATALLAGSGWTAGPRRADPRAAAMRAEAETLLVAGQFARADSAFARLLEADPGDTLALRRRASIALLGNHTADARRWLNRLLARVPDHRAGRALLAESYVREDDYAHAAPLVRALGKEGRARQLESFAGLTPYRMSGGATEVTFVQTDPLPVIQVRVNGSAPVFFIIDTGGGDIALDDVFADSVGARTFGADSGTFAGGKRGGFVYGRIDSITLGSLTVRNVPVQILSTRRFAGAAGGRRVDGILGTVFLYHLIATLDYPGGKLVLRPRTAESEAEVERMTRDGNDSTAVVPFWMTGDHYMVTWGRINDSVPLLWFVDTGLAGAGFTCPEATLHEGKIDLAHAPSFDGQGAGGKVSVQPFAVDRLSLGPFERRGTAGFFGPFPPTLEYGLGFRIAGLISHGFLRAYRITFDFVHMRYVLTT